MKYLLKHPRWGYCAISEYPALWVEEKNKAKRFDSRSEVQLAMQRWNERVVQVFTIVEVES